MMHFSLIFLNFLGVVKIDAYYKWKTSYWDWEQTQVYIYKKGSEMPGYYSRVWNKRVSTFINFKAFFQGAWTLFQTKGLNFVRKSAFFWMK